MGLETLRLELLPRSAPGDRIEDVLERRAALRTELRRKEAELRLVRGKYRQRPQPTPFPHN